MSQNHFNGLSPAEAERLAILLEQMGSAQRVIGKILRHGYLSCHPDGGLHNRNLLEDELGDVQAAITRMTNAGDIDKSEIEVRRDLKLAAGPYMHHQWS